MPVKEFKNKYELLNIGDSKSMRKAQEVTDDTDKVCLDFGTELKALCIKLADDLDNINNNSDGMCLLDTEGRGQILREIYQSLGLPPKEMWDFSFMGCILRDDLD